MQVRTEQFNIEGVMIFVWLWALLFTLLGFAVCRLSRRAKTQALKPTLANRNEFPRVTLVKPVKGLNDFSEDDFRSWLSQSYPEPVDFVFSFQDANDPAMALTEKLSREFPIRIVVNKIRDGFSAKSSNLFYGVESSTADFLIFSDADTHAPPDTIREIVCRSARGQSVVSCLPTSTTPKGPFAALYATIWNASTFGLWAPFMYLKQSPGIAGGTVGVWRDDLAKVGGIESFASYVAEDLKMGAVFKAHGYKLVLGPVIESKVGSMTARAYWDALLRSSFISWTAGDGTKLQSLFMHSFVCGYAPLLIYALGFDSRMIAPCIVILLAKMSSLSYLNFLAESKFRFPAFTFVNDLVTIAALFASLGTRKLKWADVTYRIKTNGQMVRMKEK